MNKMKKAATAPAEQIKPSQKEAKIENCLVVLVGTAQELHQVRDSLEEEGVPLVSSKTYPCYKIAKQILSQNGLIVECAGALTCHCEECSESGKAKVGFVTFGYGSINSQFSAFEIDYQPGKKLRSLLGRLDQFLEKHNLFSTQVNLPKVPRLFIVCKKNEWSDELLREAAAFALFVHRRGWKDDALQHFLQQQEPNIEGNITVQ